MRDRARQGGVFGAWNAFQIPPAGEIRYRDVRAQMQFGLVENPPSAQSAAPSLERTAQIAV